MSTSSAVPPAAWTTVDQLPTESVTEYEYVVEEVEEEIEVEVTDDDEVRGEEEFKEEIWSPIRELIIGYDGKASHSDGGMMNRETSNPSNKSSREATGGDSITSLYESNKTLSEEETAHMSAKDFSDLEKEPRLDFPVKRLRSLSPEVEIKEGNKRPALVSNFFGNDWCIKGSSCRFRHIRDRMNAIGQRKGNSVAECQKSGPRDDEGLREGVESSGLAGSSGLATSATVQMSPSNHSPVWPRTSTLLSSSWNSDSFKTVKHLGGDREEINPTFGPNVPPFSGSKSEYLYCNNDGPLVSAGSATSIFTYNWEPSKHFQPSFLLPRGISSPGSQNDSIPDRIGQPKIRDELPKLSSSSQNDLIRDSTGQSSTLSVQKETSGMEYGQNDRPEKDTKVGNDSSQYHKLDFGTERDYSTPREPVGLKRFRAALAERVKVLLTPAWCDGKLSKDAYKLIVKKAVEGVISTLPAERIPTRQEAINIYLFSSHKKLQKFVEAYIQKYGNL